MLQAKYEVWSKNTETGEELLKHTQSNLITDYGLNYFGSGSRTKTTNSDWGLNSCGIWLKEFPTPSKDLTELFVPYASGANDLDVRTKFKHNVDQGPSLEGPVRYFDDGEIAYREETLVYPFRHKYIVGDMYGIYLGCFNSTGNQGYYLRKDLRMYPWDYDPNSSEYRYVYDHVFSIFSAIQFKNEDGEPKTIPVTDIEQIFIKYTIRKYFPKYSPPKTFKITTSVGTSHDVIVRANWGDREYISREHNTNSRRATQRFSPEYYDSSQTWSVITLTSSDGTSTNYTNGSGDFSYQVKPYVNNSYKQSTQYFFNLNAFNKPIKTIQAGNSMGAIVLEITPPIEKTNEKTLNFALEWGWGREEDIIVNFLNLVLKNPKFEIDLSDWNLINPDNIVRNTLDNYTTLFFSGASKTSSLSQTVELSNTSLQNKRIHFKWKQKNSGASIKGIKIEYIDADGGVLDTQILTDMKDLYYSTFTNTYSIANVSTKGLQAQSLKITYDLASNSSTSAYLAITDLEILLSNMTALS